MTRWIYVRPLLDKFSGKSYHVSVTGDTGGPVPYRVVETLDELDQIFIRAGLGELLGPIHFSIANNQAYTSGPRSLTAAQEQILLPRETDPQFKAAVSAVISQLQKRGANQDYCSRCGTNDWNADLVRVSLTPMAIAGGDVTVPSQAYMPALAIVCKKCGNTIFHNLNSLDRDFLDSLRLR